MQRRRSEIKNENENTCENKKYAYNKTEQKLERQRTEKKREKEKGKVERKKKKRREKKIALHKD